jgi:glycosyltransferase involved in cell wall biosynthesis
MLVGVVLEQLLSPVPGGTGRYSADLATALADTAPEGACVDGWVALHRNIHSAALPGVYGPRRLPLGRRLLASLWERGVGPSLRGVDVVHAPTVLAPPRRRRPLVVTIHDAIPWTHPETLTPRGVRFHRRMVGRAARYADLIVVPSVAAATDLEGAVPALHGRCTVIRPGVSPRLRAPADGTQQTISMGLPPHGFLLTVATLEPRKGLDVLLRALAQPDAPDLPLVIVGQPGWGGVDVGQLASRYGLRPGRVRILGRVPDEDLAILYSQATAVVVPSRWEGFGLPVLEGMAAGAPVVCSDVPALREVGGDAVVTVPTGDSTALAHALAKLSVDAQLRVDLGARGQRRAHDFSWERSAKQLWGAYSALL